MIVIGTIAIILLHIFSIKMNYLPETQFPFPEQSCRHKESAMLETVTNVLEVVTGTADNDTPRPLLASVLDNLKVPNPMSSFVTTFCSSSFLKEILSKQSSLRCLR